MNEVRQIFDALREVLTGGKKATLATVVRVQGSAYRREGAKTLITERGEMVGTISAGCLEGDVVECARQVIETKRPLLRRYDLTGEEELVWGFGLGCNGIIDVFIEPIEAVAESLELASQEVARGAKVAIATVVSSGERGRWATPGMKLILFENGSWRGSLGGEAFDERVLRDAQALLTRGLSRMLSYMPDPPFDVSADERASIGVYVDVFVPPEKLLVFGGGPDAVPLVRYAKDMGFHVTVVDHRPAYASPARFPSADVVVCARPEDVPEKITLTDRTYVVIVTHNFHYDLRLVAWLLQNDVAYIGVLGPRDRFRMMLERLAQEGVTVTESRRERVFAPVGLDIGADGPEQIALSIVAEILAVRNNRRGTFLRERTGPIHG